MNRRLLFVLLLAWLGSCFDARVYAQPTQPEKQASGNVPTANTVQLAPKVTYEWQRTQRLLDERELELEPSPEGKRIAFVIVVRDDVFVRDELWPMWFNWFHGLTRESVVRRELLFKEGGAYHEARIEETMRNLRGMAIFALVRIVPVRAKGRDTVGVLVHTRDLWSLRAETSFNVTNQLNSFVLNGTERNLFGYNKNVAATYSLSPKSYVLTESYVARRVLNSSVALKQSAGLVFNRVTNRTEGRLASLSIGQPYYSLAQRFAWASAYGYDNRVYRRLRSGRVARYASPDYPDGPYVYGVYRGRSQAAYLTGSYRRGRDAKQTFSLGWDFRQLDVMPTAETRLPDELGSFFRRNLMPYPRTDNGPTASYEVFLARWATFQNLATYGQSENVQVGPSSKMTLRVPIAAFGSSADGVIVHNELGLTLAPAGALIDMRAQGTFRYERERLIDQKATLLLRGASPVFSVFRLVARVAYEMRRRDSQRTFVTLGADNGLRGYNSQTFAVAGGDRLLCNVELRTLPIEWQAVHVGGVLFYDVGSVHNHLPQLAMQHAVGVGLRVLFPQINRTPFSFDGGMSFDPGFRFVPAISDGQAVPITAAEDPET